MDDERIEHALKLGPVDEPAYQRGVRGRMGATSDPTVGPFNVTSSDDELALASPTRIVVRPRAGSAALRGPRLTTFAQVAAVLAIVIVAGAVAVPGLVGGLVPSGDMLDRLRASGSIRIAVPDAPPQTVAAGGVRIGFDVDVAKALAAELGLDLTLVPIATTLQSTSDFDVAIGPSYLPVASEGVASEPYAFYPTWLAVPADASIRSVEALTGKRVCVVTGSGGPAWARPVELTLVPAPTEDGCIASVAEGRADALITSGLLSDELASRGLVPVPNPAAGDPLAEEPRVVIVPRSEVPSDTLAAAIDAAVRHLRASGRLADLSRASFGGRDLTEAKP